MITVFDPRGLNPQKYKASYKELSDTPEFKPLTGKELVFVWFYSNKTSPLITTNMLPENRVLRALQLAEMIKPKDSNDIGKYLNSRELDNYLDLVFPDYIKIAMDKMAEFQPGIRDAARTMLVSVFNNLKKVEDLSNYTDKDGGYDMGAYMRATKTLSETLPSIIAQLEHGFGVKEVDESMSEETGDSVAQRFFNEQKR